MTGDLLTDWRLDGDTFRPAVLIDHPLPAGGGHDDLSAHQHLPTPNVTMTRVLRVPQQWFDDVEAAEPGTVIVGPEADPDG